LHLFSLFFLFWKQRSFSFHFFGATDEPWPGQGKRIQIRSSGPVHSKLPKCPMNESCP